MTTLPSDTFYSSEMPREACEGIAEADDLKMAWRALTNEVLLQQLTHGSVH